jgi:hypothetical protein
MATIYKEWLIAASAEHVWDRLRDFYALHERLVPGFVTACRAEPGVRFIRFFNGFEAREALIGLSEQPVMRVSYTSLDTKATHHSASAQVFTVDDGQCRLVWITDVLPDEIAATIAPMMDRGGAVMKATLEGPH